MAFGLAHIELALAALLLFHFDWQGVTGRGRDGGCLAELDMPEAFGITITTDLVLVAVPRSRPGLHR